MTRENAKKLQSMMAKEAVTLLMLGGAEADTAEHPVLYAGRRCAGADAARVPALSGRRPALRLGQPGCWYGLRRRAVQGRRNTGANMSAAGKQASV